MNNNFISVKALQLKVSKCFENFIQETHPKITLNSYDLDAYMKKISLGKNVSDLVYKEHFSLFSLSRNSESLAVSLKLL